MLKHSGIEKGADQRDKTSFVANRGSGWGYLNISYQLNFRINISYQLKICPNISYQLKFAIIS